MSDLKTSRNSRGTMRQLFGVSGLALALLGSLGVTAVSATPVVRQAETTNATAEPESTGPCVSTNCVLNGAEIIQTVDLSIDPCEDFYGYVCAKWEAENPIPDDQSRWSTFSDINLDVIGNLRAIFESEQVPVVNEVDAILNSVKSYYASCMDTATADAAGIEAVQSILDAVDSWSAGQMELSALMAHLHMHSINAVFGMQVWTDEGDNTRYMMRVAQSGLGLPNKDYYVNEGVVAAYKEYLTSLLQLAAVVDTEEAAATQADGIIALEAAIANISLTPVELRDTDATYNPTPVGQLGNLTGEGAGFTWMGYLEALDAPIVPELVNVATPTFFQALMPALLEHAAALPAYFKATTLRTLAAYMPSEFQQARSKYQEVITGAGAATVRWTQCVGETHDNYVFAVGRMYAEKHFPASYRDLVLTMVEDLYVAMNDTIQTIEWMSPETKVSAEQKLTQMNAKIGYPDEVFDDDWMVKEYAAYEPAVNTTYLANVVNAWYAYEVKELEQLNQSVDHSRWVTGPAVVNAFYNPTSNDITFPAGIMNPPFFSSEYPSSFNYGGLGMVIGHEITHGFDDQGRKYDGTGNINDWWTPEDATTYEGLAQCFIDQYSTYGVETSNGTMYLNGALTLGENTADNGGIAQAWKAYQTWVERNGALPQLPGTELTHDQMFFIGFARGFCGAYRPARMTSQVINGPHSPGGQRIIGVASNSPEFATAFNCPAAAPMNPETKCAIW